MQFKISPVQSITFNNHHFYIKRDDLLHPEFSGNKARKFYYYLDNDFPEITKIISYGSPQANSLYSFSALAKLKNWQLDFYVDHIPEYLRQNPIGNYAAAIKNNAHIISIGRVRGDNSMEEFILKKILPRETKSLFVPEGGRCQYAESGVTGLAEEILCWSEQHQIKSLKVFLPSGTGTTALFLQKHLPFSVLSCSCVGGDDYLKKQFYQLNGNKSEHPIIINNNKKYHFGKLYPEFYQIWNELVQQTDITFELLYDPLGWLTLLNYLDHSKDKTPFLYIHQGGLLGNESMLPRYQRKFGCYSG